MSRLRVVYIASLVVLAVLIITTVFRPMATIGEYSETQRAQLLQTEDEWIIQFDLINHEGKEQKYTITALVDGKQYTEDVSLLDSRIFTYIHRIHRDTARNGNVTFTIYKNGETDPFKQVTYYLKRKSNEKVY